MNHEFDFDGKNDSNINKDKLRDFDSINSSPEQKHINVQIKKDNDKKSYLKFLVTCFVIIAVAGTTFFLFTESSEIKELKKQIEVLKLDNSSKEDEIFSLLKRLDEVEKSGKLKSEEIARLRAALYEKIKNVGISADTNDIQYYKYTNGRFGYSIYVPNNLKVDVIPSNDDGRVFKDDNGSILYVVGSHNYKGNTIREEFNMALKSHPNPEYKAIGSDWFVISYYEGKNIVYEKRFISRKYINAFYFKYNKKFANVYNSICEMVDSNFVPGWRTGNQIRG